MLCGVLLVRGVIWRLVVIGSLPAAFVADFSERCVQAHPTGNLDGLADRLTCTGLSFRDGTPPRQLCS